MYSYETEALARVVIDDRLSDASRLRLAREVRRHQRSAHTPIESRRLPRGSRLRSVLHLGHAYS